MTEQAGYIMYRRASVEYDNLAVGVPGVLQIDLADAPYAIIEHMRAVHEWHYQQQRARALASDDPPSFGPIADAAPGDTPVG